MRQRPHFNVAAGLASGISRVNRWNAIEAEAFTGSAGSLAGPFVRAAVHFLAVAIMVVATPAGALRQIELQNLIDDGNGIANERIMGVTNAKADQLEKIRADNVAGEVHAAAIGDLNERRVG